MVGQIQSRYTLAIRKRDIGEGCFGAVAEYHCQFCGPVWDEPEMVCTDKGSMWEPPCYEWTCPHCRSFEFGENWEGGLGFTIVNKRAIRIKSRSLGWSK